MKALLALEDGSLFWGTSLGVSGTTVGEVVFNTAMMGYQEALTDPASLHKLMAFTYPHIGSVGMNHEDDESPMMAAAGLIIRDYPLLHSNFRAQQTLADYLQQKNTVAIADVDTRALTRLLREKGSLRGAIVASDDIDEQAVVALAQQAAGLASSELAAKVSTQAQTEFTQGAWSLTEGYQQADTANLTQHVVAYDFGVNKSSLNALVAAGCRVTLVPANTSAAEVQALNPNGIFLSNGPGDASASTAIITEIKQLLAGNTPILAIGFGHHLLALAAGASLLKLPFGQHGANQPIKQVSSGKSFIATVNQSFAVDGDSLPAGVEESYVSLFDGSNQGIQFKDKPFVGFQGYLAESELNVDLIHFTNDFVQHMKQH